MSSEFRGGGSAHGADGQQAPRGLPRAGCVRVVTATAPPLESRLDALYSTPLYAAWGGAWARHEPMRHPSHPHVPPHTSAASGGAKQGATPAAHPPRTQPSPTPRARSSRRGAAARRINALHPSRCAHAAIVALLTAAPSC
eukprot:6667143-Prymnesium_polylepis.2